MHLLTCDCFVFKVAVLIPFRNRHEHLPIFFLHLIPMLQKQRLEFAFYVIEQVRIFFSKRFKSLLELKKLESTERR